MGGHSQPRARGHPRRAPAAPSRSDQEVGAEVRTPPEVLQAHLCCRACAGGSELGSALAPSPPGWLVPAASPEGRGRLSPTGPALPEGPSSITGSPRCPAGASSPSCRAPLAPHTLPSPCGPALAGCSASLGQPGPARATHARRVWSQRAQPVPGHRCEDAADGQRCRPGTGHPRHCHPPRGPRAPRCCWGPSCREGAVPTHSRAGVCPCAPPPQLPRDRQNPQSSWAVDRSHVSAAAPARQQWKMAKNVGLDLTRLEPAVQACRHCFPRGETEAQMDLSAIIQQLSTSRCEGHLFPWKNNRQLGRAVH